MLAAPHHHGWRWLDTWRFKICASAEMFTITNEHHHPRLLVVHESATNLFNISHQTRIQGIEGSRAIEFNECYMTPPFHFYVFIGDDLLMIQTHGRTLHSLLTRFLL